MRDLLFHPIVATLGWALLHFLWQGTAVAVLLALMPWRSAKIRYAASCVAMLTMLMLPLATFAVLSAPQSAVSQPDGPSAHTQPVPPGPQDTLAPVHKTASEWCEPMLPWLVAAWSAGVLIFSLRFAGGWFMAQRLARRSMRPAPDAWIHRCELLARRLRVSRPVRLCESVLVQTPAVVGWLRPAILMPASALTGLSPEMIEALLAHELAHIRRHDYLVNLLQTAVETLLFYHPAVWWVSRQIREEREHCCDDLAVAACGNVLVYARALADLEQLRAPDTHFALAAGGGSLLSRVRRLVGVAEPRSDRGAAWLAAFIAVAAVLTVWVGVVLGQTPKPSPAPAPQAAPRPSQPQAPATPPRAAEPTRDFIGRMDDAGYSGLTVDQLVALKIHDVTPGYIGDLKAAGFAKLPVDDLIAFRIHGVTPDFLRELKALNLGTLSPDDVVALKIHGVTPEFVRALGSAGFNGLKADDVVAARIHGITPEFVRDIKILNLGTISFDDAVALMIHGASPEFVRALAAQGFKRLTADDVVAARIHGVTPEFVRDIKALGYPDLTMDNAVALRIHEITPEFIREARKRGFEKLSIDELIQLKLLGNLRKSAVL